MLGTVGADGSQDGLLLPDGTRLVHIGPPKTGTTALQAAFHLARRSAREQGVHYAGFGRHSATEVRAVVGLRSPWSEDRKPPPIRYWNRLAGEIRNSSARCVVLSSEDFARADEDTIRRIISNLGGAPIHVAVTLRPIARLLPSQWQQYVQNRLTEPFDAWLEGTLGTARRGRSKDFWGRQRHDELIRRWAGVVGTANVTVVVLDEHDHGRLFRVFEDLTGLRRGTLAPDSALSNRSLTLAEIEVIRAFNVLYRAEKLAKPLYTRVMRRGAAAMMEARRPGPDEARVELPPWSLEPVAEIARDIVAGIGTTGVRVVGDLGRLTEAKTTRRNGAPDVHVTPEIAAGAAMGILVATGAVRGRGARDGQDASEPGTPLAVARPYAEPLELFRVSTPQLGLVLLRRARAALLGWRDRLLRRRGA